MNTLRKKKTIKVLPDLKPLAKVIGLNDAVNFLKANRKKAAMMAGGAVAGYVGVMHALPYLHEHVPAYRFASRGLGDVGLMAAAYLMGTWGYKALTQDIGKMRLLFSGLLNTSITVMVAAIPALVTFEILANGDILVSGGGSVGNGIAMNALLYSYRTTEGYMMAQWGISSVLSIALFYAGYLRNIGCLTYRLVHGHDVPRHAGEFHREAVGVEPVKPKIQGRNPGKGLSVWFGQDMSGQDVNWHPTDTSQVMNTNSGIIGTMGTGKTQFIKSVVMQLAKGADQNVGDNPIGMLIFDYKNDYGDSQFVNETNADCHKLLRLPYNPLSLHGDMPMLPAHIAAGFAETMGRAFAMGPKQKLRLESVIMDAYKAAGINPDQADTWTRPAPTIEDVWQVFIRSGDDGGEPDQDSLYAALYKLISLKVFEPISSNTTSLYELINGITVIRLDGYPPELQSLVVALTLDLFYAQMQKEGKPAVQGDLRQITKMILVDEADSFMSQDFVALRKILKEGREYGVGVMLSTQDITHFKTKENDYSAYVLTWVVHKVDQIKNSHIQSIFGVSEKPRQNALMDAIRRLGKHKSIYVGGDKQPVEMNDRAFWQWFAEK